MWGEWNKVRRIEGRKNRCGVKGDLRRKGMNRRRNKGCDCNKRRKENCWKCNGWNGNVIRRKEKRLKENGRRDRNEKGKEERGGL